jgi:hypothetical protein
MAGPSGVAIDDAPDCILHRGDIACVDAVSATRGLIEKRLDRDDEPERGVYRIELGLIACVRKPIGQHSLGDGVGPGQQDAARLLAARGGKANPWQRNERIATPIGEPWVAGDDGRSGAAPDEIRVRGSVERRGECRAPRSFRGTQGVEIHTGGVTRRAGGES